MTATPRYGLGKSRRLRSGQLLREVSRTGRRLRDGLFSVHARQNDFGHARLGITVSRRVSRKAVVRNRIKRCVRESFRVTQTGLGSLDLVVIAQPAAGGADNPTLLRALQRHWINIR